MSMALHMLRSALDEDGHLDLVPCLDSSMQQQQQRRIGSLEAFRCATALKLSLRPLANPREHCQHDACTGRFTC